MSISCLVQVSLVPIQVSFSARLGQFPCRSAVSFSTSMWIFDTLFMLVSVLFHAHLGCPLGSVTVCTCSGQLQCLSRSVSMPLDGSFSTSSGQFQCLFMPVPVPMQTKSVLTGKNTHTHTHTRTHARTHARTHTHKQTLTRTRAYAHIDNNNTRPHRSRKTTTQQPGNDVTKRGIDVTDL